MLWKKLNNLSASLKQQPVLGSNKSFLKFQLQHQSCNLPSEGRSCCRRARRTVRHVDREFNNTILLIMIPSTSAASNNAEHSECHRTGRNVFVVPVIIIGGATVLEMHPLRVFLPILKSNLHLITNKPADVRAEDALLSGSLCGWLSCSAAGHFYPQVLLGDRSILTTRVFWGNDGARKWNLPICNLLSALHTVVMWVNEREGCYANVSSGHLAETFQYLLGPAWRSRHRSELQLHDTHHWDRRSCCQVFRCSFFFFFGYLY